MIGQRALGVKSFGVKFLAFREFNLVGLGVEVKYAMDTFRDDSDRGRWQTGGRGER